MPEFYPSPEQQLFDMLTFHYERAGEEPAADGQVSLRDDAREIDYHILPGHSQTWELHCQAPEGATLHMPITEGVTLGTAAARFLVTPEATHAMLGDKPIEVGRVTAFTLLNSLSRIFGLQGEFTESPEVMTIPNVLPTPNDSLLALYYRAHAVEDALMAVVNADTDEMTVMPDVFTKYETLDPDDERRLIFEDGEVVTIYGASLITDEEGEVIEDIACVVQYGGQGTWESPPEDGIVCYLISEYEFHLRTMDGEEIVAKSLDLAVDADEVILMKEDTEMVLLDEESQDLLGSILLQVQPVSFPEQIDPQG